MSGREKVGRSNKERKDKQTNTKTEQIIMSYTQWVVNQSPEQEAPDKSF